MDLRKQRFLVGKYSWFFGFFLPGPDVKLELVPLVHTVLVVRGREFVLEEVEGLLEVDLVGGCVVLTDIEL